MMVELVLIDIMLLADPGGRALCVGMWPFVCWDCGFESRRGGDVYVFCKCCVW